MVVIAQLVSFCREQTLFWKSIVYCCKSAKNSQMFEIPLNLSWIYSTCCCVCLYFLLLYLKMWMKFVFPWIKTAISLFYRYFWAQITPRRVVFSCLFLTSFHELRQRCTSCIRVVLEPSDICHRPVRCFSFQIFFFKL